MEKNTFTKSVNQKNTANKIIFVILSFLIASILIFDFIKFSNAYFTDTTISNSPVITTGNVAIEYGLYDSEGIEVSSPFYMDDNQLIPGSEIPYTFIVKNKGTRDCYLRFKLDFMIKNDGEWEVDETHCNANGVHNYITIASNDSETTTFLFANDGYLYYKYGNGKLTSQQVSEPIEVKILINASFPTQSEAYAGKNFSLRFGIQAMQTYNITQTTSKGWTTEVGEDEYYVDWEGVLVE